LFDFRPDFERGDQQIHPTVPVEIVRHGCPAILLESDAEKMSRFDESGAGSIEVEPVQVIAAVGPAAAAGASDLGAEISGL